MYVCFCFPFKIRYTHSSVYNEIVDKDEYFRGKKSVTHNIYEEKKCHPAIIIGYMRLVRNKQKYFTPFCYFGF